MAKFDNSKPFVWEDADRLSAALDSILDDEMPAPDETGAELDLRAGAEFGSLVADMRELSRSTVAVLLSPDATEEHKRRARNEFVDIMSEASALLKSRLAALEPNLDRTLGMH